MKYLSLVINCDTRPPKGTVDGMFSGTSNEDYLIDGILNKQKFFSGFDIETIVFVDKHTEIPKSVIDYLHSTCDTVIIRKHTNEPSFNCYNYLDALSQARGQYVCHCDQDTSLFTSGEDYIRELIAHLDNYKFVSYPSMWSPKAVHDESFGNRTWASTRFFICKRETLKFDVLRQCVEEPEWAYQQFGDSPRRCNWLEHFLTLSNNDSCYYPPVDIDKGLIFSWGSYEKYTLRRLNEYNHDQIKEWQQTHPLYYPNDINA